MLITREDMILRFSEREIAALTDHEYGKTVNVEVLARAIADAEAEAGSYLSAALFPWCIARIRTMPLSSARSLHKNRANTIWIRPTQMPYCRRSCNICSLCVASRTI